jgi:hypothetical protein
MKGCLPVIVLLPHLCPQSNQHFHTVIVPLAGCMVKSPSALLVNQDVDQQE